MGIRQTLNEKPALAAGVSAGIIVLAILAILFEAFHKPSTGAPPTKAYFSDDDGQTVFLDDVNKVPPFDHNGKQAFRAVVVQCGDGKPFVWRLEGYDEQQRQELLKASKEGNGRAIRFSYLSGLEMKFPGSSQWVGGPQPGQSDDEKAAFQELMFPKCPEGGVPHIVRPEENVQVAPPPAAPAAPANPPPAASGK